ncbi:MAG: hypothetical protein ACRCXB_23160 [Aeromonadaceae bacterium]
MTKRTGTDKSLYHVSKEVIGQPWTYTAETKAKLAADMAAEKNTIFVPSEYNTKPSQGAGAVRPKSSKHPLQQTNGHRSQCVGYKRGFKVGSERTLPPVPKDYIAVARAKRIKKHTSKLRAAPKK